MFFTARGARSFFITLFIYLFIYFVAFKKIFQEKNTTTFLKPLYGTSGRNIPNFDFSSCATNFRFGLTLVLSGHSLLKMCGAFGYKERNNFIFKFERIVLTGGEKMKTIDADGCK